MTGLTRSVLILMTLWSLLTERGVAQEATVRPGDQLVVEGVPPIAVSLAEEVRKYTEGRSATLFDWHPVRREMLIGTRFANTSQVHEVRMPGGARRQLTFFSEPVGSATWEPKAGKYFVFSRDRGGDEFIQLYRYDIADGAVTLLTDGGRSQNGSVLWNRAKDKFVYSTTRRNGADRDLWVMDPLDPAASKPIVELQGGGWAPLDWSPGDSKIVALQYLSINQSVLWEINVADGKMKPLTDQEARIAWGTARYRRDGKGLYVTSDQDNEFRRLGLMDLATGGTRWLTSDIPWDVESMELSRDGKRLAFETNEAGVSKLWMMTTDDEKYRAIEGLPVGVLGGMAWHDAADELAFSIASARSTSDIYSVAADGGKVTRWTESELGGLVAERLVEPELIRWTSFDGREITGFLYRADPKFKGKRPVIINIHGGPEGQSRPIFQGRNNYFMNELGVAMIFPNVRGSSGYGKSYVALDNAERREDSVRDIGALLDAIAKRDDLDPQRVMVTGGSYGGYMTLACATWYNDRLRCALDIVGISHFGTFLKNTESYRRDLRRAEYGDERDPKMAEFFERTAPLNNASKITKPLFVVQGGNDPRVPLSEAEQIVAKVRQNGSPVWYLMARDEGHGFRKKGNADFQFYATVEFVKRHLIGE